MAKSDNPWKGRCLAYRRALEAVAVQKRIIADDQGDVTVFLCQYCFADDLKEKPLHHKSWCPLAWELPE